MLSYSLPTGQISVWKHLEWDKYSAFSSTLLPLVSLVPQFLSSPKCPEQEKLHCLGIRSGFTKRSKTSPYSASKNTNKIKPFRQLSYYKKPCLPFTFNPLTVVTDKNQHLFSLKRRQCLFEATRCYISAISFFLPMTLCYCCYASVVVIRCGFLQCSWTKSFLLPLPFHPAVMMTAWCLAGRPQHDMRHRFKCPTTCLFQAGSSNLSLKKGTHLWWRDIGMFLENRYSSSPGNVCRISEKYLIGSKRNLRVSHLILIVAIDLWFPSQNTSLMYILNQKTGFCTWEAIIIQDKI